ncbi:MAG: DUF4143 domain-containing protein [Phycisphaerae bacterium]|nr:DUF4143 domain-containing protein [Phycisphaerae bacterium]
MLRLLPFACNETQRTDRVPSTIDEAILRGALFETWVVTEILKNRLNRGELRPLYFYRDVRGIEVDPLVERGLVRTVVEIKAGQTVSEEAIHEHRGYCATNVARAKIHNTCENPARDAVVRWIRGLP